VTLAFDAETKLLSRQETATTDPTLGVVVVSLSYEDWTKAGELMLPIVYEERVNGVVTFQQLVRAIALDTSPSDALFALPRGYAPMPEPGTVASRRGSGT
jgi:hypothetical protein